VEWVCGLRGHEMLCEVDVEFISDNFNLYGLRGDWTVPYRPSSDQTFCRTDVIPNYSDCLRIILDKSDESDLEADIQDDAFDLYGLIHSRYIITAHGLQAMVCAHSVRACQ
jgi:casein kinase II subunit beta